MGATVYFWARPDVQKEKLDYLLVDVMDTMTTRRFFARPDTVRFDETGKASAEQPSDQGCMMEHMGCLGTQARADCNTRLWNGEGSCLRGGYACINCTAPEFEDIDNCFSETPKIAGIPIGLPTDMPKAWFALASLDKAATPRRLKVNAQSDHIRISPGMHKDEDSSA